MDNVEFKKCQEQLSRFERKVKSRDTEWAAQNGESHQVLARVYLVNEMNYIPKKISCKKCSGWMELEGESYRCEKFSCRREISWKNGTIFQNLEEIRVNHVLMVFAKTALFTLQQSDVDSLAADYSIPYGLANRYWATAYQIIARWRTNVTYTPGQIRAGERRLLPDRLFAKRFEPEKRLPMFFELFTRWSRERDSEFATCLDSADDGAVQEVSDSPQGSLKDSERDDNRSISGKCQPSLFNDCPSSSRGVKSQGVTHCGFSETTSESKGTPEETTLENSTPLLQSIPENDTKSTAEAIAPRKNQFNFLS